MAGLTELKVLPYRSNSIIIINNNIGTGSALSTYVYKVYVQKYGLDGVLTPTTPTLIEDTLTPIDDDAKYGTNTTTINAIINPYDSTSSIPLQSKLGLEYAPDTDGVYKLTISKVGEGSITVDFTIINGILTCRKQFYDKVLKKENTDCNCLPKTFDEYIANYIEFNNLWFTIQCYGNNLQMFLPNATHPDTFLEDIRNIYNLIERANKYCIMCDNKCITCK